MDFFCLPAVTVCFPDSGNHPCPLFHSLYGFPDRGCLFIRFGQVVIQLSGGKDFFPVQIVRKVQHLLHVFDGAVRLCPVAPARPLRSPDFQLCLQKITEIDRLRLCRFLCLYLLPCFMHRADPVREFPDHAADRLHQAVCLPDLPVQVPDVCLDAFLFHRRCGSSHMPGWNLVDALPLVGLEAHALGALVPLQIPVLVLFPALPPDLRILFFIPVHSINLAAFPLPAGKTDTLSVFIKDIFLPRFRKPLPVLIDAAHGQHDVNMGIMHRRRGIMDRDVTAHPPGNKVLPAVFLHHPDGLIKRQLLRESCNNSAGELRVKPRFRFLDRVPECRPVGILRRRVCREHQPRKHKLRLFVGIVLCPSVILAEQFLRALVGSSRNG